jgi:hypothetical protein
MRFRSEDVSVFNVPVMLMAFKTKFASPRGLSRVDRSIFVRPTLTYLLLLIIIRWLYCTMFGKTLLNHPVYMHETSSQNLVNDAVICIALVMDEIMSMEHGAIVMTEE